MSKSKQYKLGQHLRVSNGLYTHHGIYVGSGKVIHYAGKSNGLFDDSYSYVQESTLEEFASGRNVYQLTESNAKYTASEIVQRAKSRVGENSYSVFTNNCEHFVNWCIHGEHNSAQVQRAGAIAGALTTGSGVVRVYQASKTTTTLVNVTRGALIASSSSSKAGLIASAASGSGAATAAAALTGGSVATGSTAAGFVATGSAILASPLAPVAAAALLTGGVVYGVGKLFDFW